MLTGIVLTKNSADTLEKCLVSIKFCDEILVVDNYSTDKSEEIAKKTGATFIQKKLDNDFAEVRNYAMEKTKEGWILFVDADEEVSNELGKEIESVIAIPMAFDHREKQSHVIATSRKSGTRDDDFTAFRVRRQDVFFGRKLQWGEVRKAYTQGIVRLVKKGSGKWEGRVHEEFKTNEKVGQLQSILYHYPHPSIADFLNDINEYSSIRAQELFKKGFSGNILHVIFLPPLKFVYTYFIKLGFLDGPEGFIYSFMMSFHSFLVRGKLYLLKSK